MFLTPKHYKKCLVVVTHTLSSGIHLCSRQFKNNKVKPFILTKLHGYPKLKSLLCNGGVDMQSQLEVWRMFRKFETSSSSNQIPQRALTGSKLAQLIGNHLLNLHMDGKTWVQMCWNLCTYVNIMLELVDQSKIHPLLVNLLIRIPVPRSTREKKTRWDFQGNYGVQWVQISTQPIKHCSMWL